MYEDDESRITFHESFFTHRASLFNLSFSQVARGVRRIERIDINATSLLEARPYGCPNQHLDVPVKVLADSTVVAGPRSYVKVRSRVNVKIVRRVAEERIDLHQHIFQHLRELESFFG